MTAGQDLALNWQDSHNKVEWARRTEHYGPDSLSAIVFTGNFEKHKHEQYHAEATSWLRYYIRYTDAPQVYACKMFTTPSSKVPLCKKYQRGLPLRNIQRRFSHNTVSSPLNWRSHLLLCIRPSIRANLHHFEWRWDQRRAAERDKTGGFSSSKWYSWFTAPPVH